MENSKQKQDLVEEQTLPNNNNKRTAEEEELFVRLYENVAEDLKSPFLRYCELRTVRQNQEEKAAYEMGFKKALKLTMEALKEE